MMDCRRKVMHRRPAPYLSGCTDDHEQSKSDMSLCGESILTFDDHADAQLFGCLVFRSRILG